MSSRLLLQGGWECGNYLWKYRKDLLIEAEGYHYLIRSRSVRNKSRPRTKNPIAPRCWSISAQYLSSPENLIPIWKLWELTVNLRANREITPGPEGLYIRQRAIRVRDCASIIPECAFLPSIEEFFLLGLGLSIIASLSCYSDLTRNLGIKWSFLQLFDLRRAIGVLCSPKVLVKYALPNADQAISDLMLGFSSQDNGPSIFLAPFQATRDGEGY